jgi:hypothetical protein
MASVADMISRFREGKPSSREERGRSQPTKMWWQETSDDQQSSSSNRQAGAELDDMNIDEIDRVGSSYNPYHNDDPPSMRSGLDVKPAKQQKHYKSEALEYLFKPTDYMSSSLELRSSRDGRYGGKQSKRKASEVVMSLSH